MRTEKWRVHVDARIFCDDENDPRIKAYIQFAKKHGFRIIKRHGMRLSGYLATPGYKEKMCYCIEMTCRTNIPVLRRLWLATKDDPACLKPAMVPPDKDLYKWVQCIQNKDVRMYYYWTVNSWIIYPRRGRLKPLTNPLKGVPT